MKGVRKWCGACKVKTGDYCRYTGKSYDLDALGRDSLCRWMKKTFYQHLSWTVRPGITYFSMLFCVSLHEAFDVTPVGC
jgi:hypothetical protein